MKKIICLLLVVLMIGAVAYAAAKVKIAKKDLPALKGTCEGTIGFGLMEGGGTSPAKLEILNDTVPVKAKLTITNVPANVATEFQLPSGQNVAESEEGLITSQGTLLWVGAQKNFIELTMVSKDKVNVWYYVRGLKGEGDLKKK